MQYVAQRRAAGRPSWATNRAGRRHIVVSIRPISVRCVVFVSLAARLRRGTEAAEWAKKAQICFNECVRALQPHWDLLKREELQDCEDLQNTGLLQAVQLYKLMYGGKILAMGITRGYPPIPS